MSNFQTVSRFGTTIASAATIVIPIDGDFFQVSGTTTITAMTTSPVGAQPRAVGSIFRLRFTGAAPLTHNATTLILADGANYTPRVGEVLTFEVVAANQVREHGPRLRAVLFPQLTRTSAYTLTDADYELICSGGSFNITLPAATGRNSKPFRIVKALGDSSNNIVSIVGTIAGSSTRSLRVGGSFIEVVSDGTSWQIVAFEVPGIVPIAWAATITPDASVLPRQGGNFGVTLGGATTIAAPLSPADAQELSLFLTQDATGGRIVTWNAAFGFNTTFPAPALSTTANKVDIVYFQYSAALSKWLCIGYALGN